MSLPVLRTHNLPVRTSTPVASPLLMAVRVLGARAVPAIRASLVFAGAGMVAEYVLRALATRAVDALSTRPAAVAPPSETSVAVRTRIVVTEFVIRETVRRTR